MKKNLFKVTIILSMLLLTLIPLSVNAATNRTYGDLTYTISNNGNVTIVDCNTYADEIEIPREIDSFTVTTIGSYAFKDCENLTTVIIPNSVTSIGWNAFENCSNLLEINIPDSVTSIGGYAFQYCSKLENVNISNNVTILQDMTFNGCTSLSTVRFGIQLTDIMSHVFSDCRKLTDITLPDNLKYIGNQAFRGCSKLKNIYIPASVTYIGNNVFIYCTALTDISVNSNNIYYSSNDGNLFDKNQSILIQYALGKTNKDYIIPNSVTKINDYAFDNCTSLASITIPESVTTIGPYAFNWCSKLKTIYLPKSLENIKDYAFSACLGLTDVYYNMRNVTWDDVKQNIKIGSGNTYLTNATLHSLNININITKTNNIFIVTPLNVYNDEYIIFACYKDNKMVDVNPYIYAGETTIPFKTTKTYDKVKVFVWENLKTCVPLCEAEEITFTN